jgi:hypothetical protein
MRPQGTRVLRREQRRALRGVPTGRRQTHRTETIRPRQHQYDMHVRIWRFVQLNERRWADREAAA